MEPRPVRWNKIRHRGVISNVRVFEGGVGECQKSGAPRNLKRLADGGSDTLSNAFAACPNCHRELHYGVNKEKRRLEIYGLVKRLVPE